ncbi:protein pthb1-like isoform x1 [Plakobranchus ocellatus]|uniref:Protein pthb1-like isoform x1 n=1 Tax=Plakobranchus ocellatus TaxID=259542 RepID=A0AAV4BGF0_9GAST|nr:protein pthb1-like isoform x1 [Plakobranchus ocellatus]
MSLFKTRDWWSASVGEEEEFDHGCLCTANVDNDASGHDKIIIGSFQGILRIYKPDPTSGGSVENVMVEQAFKLPILQVEVGQFSSASESLKLAVLHPRKLAVFNVTAITGAVEHGSQYQLNLLYEHNLQRTAFNFCYGPFGGVKGKDFICVQSMDGTVSIFEQESFAFSRFLPGALLPGPIQYIPKLDTFITASSSWRVEAYKYQVLAVASDTAGKQEGQGIKSGKRVAADWLYNIGEQAVDIRYLEFLSLQPSLLVLGEHNIFCLSGNGTLKFAKRLEYDPCCMLPYASLADNSVSYMVAAHTKSLMVYQDVGLKWMAKTEFVPVQIRLGNFHGLRAGIVVLSETGHLEVCYLGTDPAVFVPPMVESRDLNYAAMDAEMARLTKHVKSKSANSVITPSLKSDDDLTINVHVSPNLDDISLATGLEFAEDDGVPSTTIRIQMKSRLVLEDVRLEINCPWPLASNQSEFVISSLDPNTPSETFVAIFQRFAGLPAHMYVQISATYTSASGGRRVTTTRASLPSKLVIKPVFPVKTAVHKLTIDTNRPPASLNDLFPDLLGENAGGQGAALGFQYFGGGPIVTVLASKTSQRYRLQCDRLEAIWLPMRELVARLNGHFRKGSAHSDFRVSFDGALPLQEYFELVDTHFEFRTGSDKCRELLGQRASQFRTIQKRLLTRFKDKTPAPLQNLDTLLEGTYRQILALADAVDENSVAEMVSANNLSSGTYLLNLLLKLWVDMVEEEFRVLETTLSPVVNASEEQGWEESVDAAITHLLRTVMARSAKDQSVNPSPLGTPPDTSKVKKHIALFCDRVGKGARLVDGLKDKKEKVIKMPATKTIVETNENELPEDAAPIDQVLSSRHRKAAAGGKGRKGRKESGGILQPLGLPQMDKPDAGVPDVLDIGGSLGGFQRNLPPPEDNESKRRIQSMVPDLDDMDDGMGMSGGEASNSYFPHQDGDDGGGEGSLYLKGSADNLRRKGNMNGELHETEEDNSGLLPSLPDGYGFGPAVDGDENSDEEEGGRFGKGGNEIVYAL